MEREKTQVIKGNIDLLTINKISLHLFVFMKHKTL